MEGGPEFLILPVSSTNVSFYHYLTLCSGLHHNKLENLRFPQAYIRCDTPINLLQTVVVRKSVIGSSKYPHRPAKTFI